MTEVTLSYAAVIERLRSAYDGSAAERDSFGRANWKMVEREHFLERLRAEGKLRLLELGGGTGQDSLFFKGQGINVVATDLSPNMVELCREKGLDAREMDFLSLAFPPGSFDACYAFNSLLHVPNADLGRVFSEIATILKPGALVYFGQYGGDGFEGILPDDWHNPKRFFSFRTDEQILEVVDCHFEVLDFHVVEASDHFQSLTLRVPT